MRILFWWLTETAAWLTNMGLFSYFSTLDSTQPPSALAENDHGVSAQEDSSTLTHQVPQNNSNSEVRTLEECMAILSDPQVGRHRIIHYWHNAGDIYCSVFVWKISLLFFREVLVSLATKRWWTWWLHAEYWTINWRLSWRLQRGAWPSGEKFCRPNCPSTLLWLVFPTRTMTIQRYWQHTLL